jgi:hypothetical protein
MSCRPRAIWVTALCVALIATGPLFADTRAAEQEIGHILDLFERAHLEEDLELLGSLLSDSAYVLVMPRPADPSTALVLGKVELLRMYAGLFQQSELSEHRHVDRQIFVEGPVARSVSTISETTVGGERRRTRVHHLYVWNGTAWQVVFTTSVLPGN